ncbi:bifunctional DNA primase/polymerase [Actinacidiphila yeochonensis]|uniref:bifunctional DNA primase/polymerase n=1 Tax=Actinacidiphila yeochonensis TaxID=89050 RepID=UPI0005616CC4|nr:bifunctional DNA primase/polymerase [Actinacidiphila yeochonensis]
MAGMNRLSDWLRRRQDGSSGPARAPRSGRASRSARPQLPDPDRDDLIRAAVRAGFPVAPAAHPDGFGCSCERIGCPIPGLHPISPAWQTQASTDPQRVEDWLRVHPMANVVAATGEHVDVLDVPVEAGLVALERLSADAATLGPVAALGEERMLFFTETRGTPADEDEWWPCELDSHPETAEERPGIRWHCRGSYVLLPPARLPSGDIVRWLPDLGPDLPLPDPLPVLDILTDACAQFGYEPESESLAWGR